MTLGLFYIVAVFLLVLANGFFVASEFALVGVRRSRIETLAARGNRSARRLLHLLDHLNAYISATQLGITMASLALGWIGEPVFAHLLEAPLQGVVSDVTLHTISFTAAFTIITFLHIVFGELAPKTFALERTEQVALAISWPMDVFSRIFYWPIHLLNWAGTHTVRLFGLRPSGDHASVYTEDELRRLVDISLKSGHLEPAQRQLLHRVFEFAEVGVREAMIPRPQVEAVPVTATLEQVRAVFLATGFSRLAVYRERSDDLIGIAYRKDLDMGQIEPEGFDLEKLMRPPAFVPESLSAGEALKQMQASRVHFAFVLNEHGGIEGILTLDDLLEEIVGEISDEYDKEVREQIVAEQGSYVLDGMLAVRNANQQLGLELPEDEGYTTIAGFLMAQAGRMLREGDTVEYQGARFKIERVDGWRIRRVRFTSATAERVSQETLVPLVLAFFGSTLV